MNQQTSSTQLATFLVSFLPMPLYFILETSQQCWNRKAGTPIEVADSLVSMSCSAKFSTYTVDVQFIRLEQQTISNVLLTKLCII